MRSRSNKALLPLTAAAMGVLLAFGGAPPVQAATTGPGLQSKVTISMATLNTRIEKLPELAGLKDGDLVTIYDDGKVTDSVWQGTYVYRPAGSKITPNHLYARWKDGLVAIHTGPDDADVMKNMANHNHYFATYMEQTYAKTVRRDLINDPGIMLPVSQRQVTKSLITEPTDPAILRIPENAFLFRAEGNGVYTALTDVFEFMEGGSPVKANKLPFDKQQVPYGDQPLGVMFQ